MRQTRFRCRVLKLLMLAAATLLPSLCWSMAYPNNYPGGISVCPGVQAGQSISNSNVQSVYSECVTDGYSAGSYFHFSMGYDSGAATVKVSASSASAFSPAPTGRYYLGSLGSFGLADMGSSYAGDCWEVSSGGNDVAAQAGHVYCGWYRGAGTQNQLRIKATFSGGALTSASFTHNAPRKPTAVPLVAHWVLVCLILSFIGLSRVMWDRSAGSKA